MARGLFISEKYVKENSVIDDNVDMKLIQPTIWQCQKQYIEAYLGTQLYDDINSKVVASTLAGDDLTLVNDYIADALLYWVVYELQVSLLFKMRNVGTSTERSDFSNPVDLKQLARVEGEHAEICSKFLGIEELELKGEKSKGSHLYNFVFPAKFFKPVYKSFKSRVGCRYEQ